MILAVILAVVIYAIAVPILWYSVGTINPKEEDQ